jgi:anti-sigma regulatory factor (Ser/Thr protein kinase)
VAYESHGEADGLRMAFSAETPNIDKAVAEVADFASRHGPFPLFDIKLFLREALLNAVLYGKPAAGAPGDVHTVRVAVRLTPDALECVVSDAGPGFDWKARRGRIPPPDAESGRGVCIMEAYADEVEFNAAGNTVRLVKKRRGASSGTACGLGETGKTT